MSTRPIQVVQICTMTGSVSGAQRGVFHTLRRPLLGAEGERPIQRALLLIERHPTRGGPDLPKWAQEGQAELHRVVRGGPFDVGLIWRLSRLLGRLQPDIVHAYDTAGHLLALVLQPLHGFRLVATADVTCAMRTWWDRFSLGLEEKLLPGFDRVLAANGELARKLCRIGCRPVHVDVVSDAVDVELFRRDAVSPELRDSLQIPREARLIGGSLASLSPTRWPAFLAAVRQVADRVGPTHVLLLDAADGLDAFRAAATQANLAHRLHVLSGSQLGPQAYADMDLLVWGGPASSGTTVLEAQSMEVPVVWWGAAGDCDWVEDQVTGLVAPGDQAGLVEAISHLMSDAELVQHVTRAARLRVCQRFDAAEQVQRVAAAYRQVLAEA